MLEYLEIADQVWEWLPPGENVISKPMFASETVTFLNGSMVIFGAPVGARELSIQPPENYAVPLATKLILQAAFESRTPVHLAETYTNPGVVSVWPACLITEAIFTEVAGSERQYFNYKITLFTGV